MPKIELEDAQKAATDWLQAGFFTDNDPYHALRCAAHALYDLGLIDEDLHNTITVCNLL